MELTADPARVSALAQSLVESANAMQDALQQLHGASNALTKEWEGRAKAAYELQYDSLSRRLAGQVAMLRRSAAAVADLADEYAAADAGGAAALPG